MYSGYILVYGFQTTIDIVSKIFGKKADKDTKGEDISDEDEYEDTVDKYDLADNINKLLLDKGYEFIELLYLRCCNYDKDIVFLGVELGRTHFVYRDSIEDYQTFENYDTENRKQLDDIKKKYTENKEEILSEFDKFSNEFNLNENIPKFYTFANDCDRCT
jgi:hypothetical protein